MEKRVRTAFSICTVLSKERDKVMAKNQEISNEDSFLSKIATRIPLKAGIASFHYNDHFNTGYGEPSYLHPFSSSYSLPRRHVMDNVGYEIRTVMFKTAKGIQYEGINFSIYSNIEREK